MLLNRYRGCWGVKQCSLYPKNQSLWTSAALPTELLMPINAAGPIPPSATDSDADANAEANTALNAFSLGPEYPADGDQISHQTLLEFFLSQFSGCSGVWRACHYFSTSFRFRQSIFFSHMPTSESQMPYIRAIFLSKLPPWLRQPFSLEHSPLYLA